ncbi:MAG TPA: (2Fe-2S)-binding protein [Candidatus Dormibacteraeota bacterium]|nr:(2Fe-2S)-binding protein [Candidatus Dormibacteraeota bacterium]
MTREIRIRVNGQLKRVESAPETPLLYVLTDEMHLQGPRFGCGLAQCGSCSVLLDGGEIRSCVTPVSSVNGKSVTTLEGLPKWYAEQKKLANVPELHPIQRTVIEEQAVQCGYCYNGMIVKAAELLSKNSHPSDQEIRTAMNGHLCRCGSYPRMMKAIRRASEMMHSDTRAAESADTDSGELAVSVATGDAEAAR